MIHFRQELFGHFNLFKKHFKKLRRYMFCQGWIVQSINFYRSRHSIAICPIHKLQLVAQQIVGANEISASPNRPRGGRDINRKILLDLIYDLKCITAFAVHFVTKC